MNRYFKIILIIAAVIILLFLIIMSIVAVKFFVIGEVKSVDSIMVDNIFISETEMEFDIDSSISADMYKKYTLRVENDKLYIKIHTILTNGNGIFKRRLKIQHDFKNINEIYFEDNETTRLIWSRK